MDDRLTPALTFTDLRFPRHTLWNSNSTIPAPSHKSFTTQFGHAFPAPQYLGSALGRTAVYELPPPSGSSQFPVLVVHGLNTPALGMLSLAQEIQASNPDAHVVLFDLWGHGLSDTPIVPHGSEIFQLQILQVLAHMQWTKVHLIGFSFGGATVVRFAPYHVNNVLSVALLAPAGLLQFPGELREALEDRSGARENEAVERLFEFLEGGPLVLPSDWKDNMAEGKVVGEALRKWELCEHPGYVYSVLSMFREGGVYGSEEHFRRFEQQNLRHIVVLADHDDVCGASELHELGFRDIETVEDAGHSFVRSKPKEIVAILSRFWSNVGGARVDV